MNLKIFTCYYHKPQGINLITLPRHGYSEREKMFIFWRGKHALLLQKNKNFLFFIQIYKPVYSAYTLLKYHVIIYIFTNTLAKMSRIFITFERGVTLFYKLQTLVGIPSQAERNPVIQWQKESRHKEVSRIQVFWLSAQSSLFGITPNKTQRMCSYYVKLTIWKTPRISSF